MQCVRVVQDIWPNCRLEDARPQEESIPRASPTAKEVARLQELTTTSGRRPAQRLVETHR